MKYEWKPKQKSFRQQLFEDISFVVIVTLAIYFIGQLIKALFWPIPFLRNCRKIERAKKLGLKRDANGYFENEEDYDPELPSFEEAKRETRKERIKNEDNPMNQYRERYELNVEKYKCDPKNERYLKWYSDWKAGKVLDSGLRWTPEETIQYEEDHNDFMNPEYVNYLQLQLSLHMAKGSFRQNREFCRELGVRNLKEAQVVVAKVVEKHEEESLGIELITEIQDTYSLPYAIAKKLSKQELTGAQINARAKLIGLYLKNGLSEDVVICLASKDVDERILTNPAKVKQLNDLVVSGVPDEMAYMFVLGVVTQDDLQRVVDYGMQVAQYNQENKLGPDDIDYEDPEAKMRWCFDMLIDQKIFTEEREELEAKTGRAIWKS